MRDAASGIGLQAKGWRDGAAGTVLQGRCCRDRAAGGLCCGVGAAKTVQHGWRYRDGAAGTALQGEELQSPVSQSHDERRAV